MNEHKVKIELINGIVAIVIFVVFMQACSGEIW